MGVKQNYLDALNEQQRAAVTYCDGPELVIAGAGSGKTRVLTYKIVHLLQLGYEPWRVMALTFTNKAAREMRERVERQVGAEQAARLWMGTFHAIFARLLRINAHRVGFQRDFTIYDTSDSRSLIKLIVKELELDDKLYKPATVQAHISNVKNALISPDDYERNATLMQADADQMRPHTCAIYRAYCKRLRMAGAMDFDDLLYYTNILLRDCPDLLEKYQEMFRYILVDEYQDTNFAQHMIVHQLSRGNNRLCVVGDDAQSIYSFRGANIDIILNLQKVYRDLKIFKLEQNYRSTQMITNAANSLIEKNRSQIPKKLFSNNSLGSPISVVRCYSDYEEAYYVANHIDALKRQQGDSYEDFAILYRTNAQSRVLEEALSNGGRRDKHGNMRFAIPYRIYGGLSFYQRKEVKDAICYLRLIVNPHDEEALRRVINYPARGIGETTVGKLNAQANEYGVSLWQVMSHPTDYQQLNLNRGTLSKIAAFVDMITKLIELNQSGATALHVAQEMIRVSQIKSVLMGDNTPENISRQQNIDELVNAIKDFTENKIETDDPHISISDFLAETSLLTDQDLSDPDGEKVTLMTVHAAKGLEFKHVFIVGVEEDLFPSMLSADTLQGVEEERRLLYVAITRAQQNCVITYATSRYRNGSTRTCVMSRFVRDIDKKFLRIDAEPSTPVSWNSAADELRSLWKMTKQSSNSRSGSLRQTPTTAASSSPVSSNSPRPSSAAQHTSQSLPQGQFSLHTIDELKVGMAIVHSRFGRGVVVALDNSGAEPKIEATFSDGSTRKLMLKFARFAIEQAQ